MAVMRTRIAPVRRARIAQSVLVAATLVGCLFFANPTLGQPFGLGARQPNTTLRLPNKSSAYQYATVNAFGDLPFTFPITVVTPPGESRRLFVVEQGGTIVLIDDLDHPTRNVFLDISSRVAYANPSEEGGVLGLAFHPNYAVNGYFFVYYLCNTTTADGTGRHDRLSRFTRSRTDPNKGDPSSEVILFSQYDEKFNHNGGTILFGPDGYLYLTLGDEGHPDDMFDNAQKIDKDFFSGVIRLDVDHRPNSLPPNAHPALAGQINYWIPPDNPFVGATSFNGKPLDPTRVRTEFWAVGLRSPWRMFWDEPTGNVYVSEVGEEGSRGNHSEEINLLVRGGNYGWPYKESLDPGPKADQAPPGFESIPPLIGYERGDSGPRVGRAAIGGVVYRGTQLPELNGAYIFGDYYAGNIWKLRHSGNTVTEWEILSVDRDIVSFGLDPRNGDVLLCDVGENTVKRLISSAAANALPPTLADTGAFSDLNTLQPNAGIVPYDINVPFWSDGAVKRRWFSIPDVNKKIKPHDAQSWDFPEGTVWIKHFELEFVKGEPSSSRRVETRFLVRNGEGVYGATYRWNDSQDNATLVPEEGADQIFTIDDHGTLRQQTWHFPSRNECLTCHTPVAGFALGFTGPQLNRRVNYGSVTDSQFRALAHAGYFAGGAPSAKALVDPANTRAHLASRVRSYLAVNCAYCHQPGGFGRSLWDGRITTPTPRAGLINGPLSDNLGDPAARVVAPKSPEHSMLLQRIATTDSRYHMPPLATNVRDDQAIALLTEWINSLPKRRVPLSVRITAPKSMRATSAAITLRGTARGDDLGSVVYSVNDGPEQTATGTTEWSADTTLQPGVNRVVVYAVDDEGGRSRPARRTFKFTPPKQP